MNKEARAESAAAMAEARAAARAEAAWVEASRAAWAEAARAAWVAAWAAWDKAKAAARAAQEQELVCASIPRSSHE